MSEPLRLSTSGSPLAKQLLQAGRAERPRADGKAEAIAAALQITASGAGVHVALKQGWARWLVLALAVGAGGSAIATGAPAWIDRAVRRELAPEDLLVERAVSTALPVVPRSFAPPDPTPSSSGRAPSRSPSASVPVAEPDEAVPELDLLRRARMEVASGDPGSALATLADHARRYPAGALREEAAALNVEALARAGDKVGARVAAERFARTYPASAYGERVRSVSLIADR